MDSPRWLAPPDNALLTEDELASWFRVSGRTLDKVSDVPSVRFGKRSRRYLVRAVLRWLERQSRRAP
jgi:hypothetical protein